MKNIKITGLCQDCFKLIEFCENDWQKFTGPTTIANSIKLLAERVIALETDKSDFESHINFVDKQLIRRVEKLEKDLGALDELFDGFNLSALKVRSDFKNRIEELENKVNFLETSSIKLNWKGRGELKPDPEFNKNPQDSNPLTTIQINCLLRCIHDLRHCGYNIDVNIVEVETLLESYLGK